MNPMPPQFEEDAFISYNHDNNLLLDEKEKGWIDNFHERLEITLRELTGTEHLIWRDPRLPRNVVLVDYLHDRLKKTVLLVAILSPSYIRSQWCMGELREFCKHVRANGGLYLNGKSRIFAVVKLPIEQMPTEFAGQLSYEFYEPDKRTRHPVEFGQEMGKNKDQRYWTTLFSLAYEIKEVLSEAGRIAQPVLPGVNLFDRPVEEALKQTIYLAETTEDLKEERRQIREELVLHGYKVLPHGPSSYAIDPYRESVKENLRNSALSIHLLGRSYGLIPDGAGDRSILRLQVELADERASQQPGFKRLLWMPEGWEASDGNLNNLLQQVKIVADPHKGMEFWQTSLEEFKTLMLKRLSVNGNQPATEIAPADARLRKIYMVCDRRDLREAAPIISYLHQTRGYEVLLPEFDETDDAAAAPPTDTHQKNLLECDGVLVYYGHASSRWLSAKKADFEKLEGLKQTAESKSVRALRAKAFYVTLPHTDVKEVFVTHIAPVIKNFGPFDPACLDDFIKQLEGRTDDDQGGNDD